MNVFWGVVGILLVVGTMIDALWTTLGFAGGGPGTRRLARGMWSVALWIHRKRGWRSHVLLRTSGTVILLAAAVSWIVAIYVGYLLIFSIDPASVVSSTSGAPADLAERFYFTGYTLVTLGIGDFVPNHDVWRIVTAVAALNGLFLVTLAITYLIPVVSAAASKRQLGAVISDLGSTPSQIVQLAWQGDEFAGLSNYLSQLAQMIDLHAQQHLAYPVLHYFHSVDRRSAVGPGLAVLHDALLILAEGVEPKCRPSPIAMTPGRRALEGLIDVLRDPYDTRQLDAPPAPSLASLRAAGIPMVSDAQFETALRASANQRTLLKAHLENSGWTWEAVIGDRPAE